MRGGRQEMGMLSPGEFVLLGALEVAARVAQVWRTIQAVLARPARGLRREVPLPNQLAQTTHTMQFLGAQLAHTPAGELARDIATQLAQVRVTAQDCGGLEAPSREGLQRLSEQLWHTQEALQGLTTQLEHALAGKA